MDIDFEATWSNTTALGDVTVVDEHLAALESPCAESDSGLDNAGEGAPMSAADIERACRLFAHYVDRHDEAASDEAATDESVVAVSHPSRSNDPTRKRKRRSDETDGESERESSGVTP